MIIRGITQTQFFHIPFSWSDINKIYCTYSQNGQVVLEKDIECMRYDEERDCVQLELSQFDTLSFMKVGIPSVPQKSLIYFQIRVLLNNGEAYASVPVQDRVYDVLKNGVIGNGYVPHCNKCECDCAEDYEYTPTFTEKQVEYFDLHFANGHCPNKPGHRPPQVCDDTIIYDGGGVVGYH